MAKQAAESINKTELKMKTFLTFLISLSALAPAANAADPINPAKIAAIANSTLLAQIIAKYRKPTHIPGVDLDCDFDHASEKVSEMSGEFIIVTECWQYQWMDAANGGSRGCGMGQATELIAILDQDTDWTKPDRPLVYKVKSLTTIEP